MRVLHLSALPVWSMQGEGGMPSLHETLKGHLREGQEIHLVLPRFDLFATSLVEVIVPAGQDFEVSTAPCRWWPSVNVIRGIASRLGRNGELPYVARWVLNLATMLLLTGSLVLSAARLRYRHKRTFDLVYAHNQYAALAGWVIGKVFRIPNVTRLYGTFLADLMRRPLVWLRYPVASAGYLVPHRLLICANDGTRGDEVARRLRIDLSRFRFWQNGVDRPDLGEPVSRDDILCYAPTNLRRDSRWVVTCSRLSYWKRLDRLVRALAHCRNEGCDAQLLVAGDGPERGALEALTRDLGLSEEVVWFGAVGHDDVWRIMRVADVFTIANDVTNRCNPVYEAIRCELPIVSIRDPSTEDLLQHEQNALLAERDDPAQLGLCLRTACTDVELARRMRGAQHDLSAALWTWAERMQEEVAVLKGLLPSEFRHASVPKIR